MSSGDVAVTRRGVATSEYRILSVLLYFSLTLWLYGVDLFSNTRIIGGAGADMAQEVWFLAWPAYALTHLHNPFFTNWMNYPTGLNMMANTSMPLLGVLATPITLLFGPVASYTLLMRLGFILSACSAQFVARRIGLSRSGAVAAGLLYGFSTFQLVEGHGHLFLVFAPIPPLVLYAVYCLIIGRWGPVRAGLTVGILSALDFLISAERALMTLLILAVVLILAALIRFRHITWWLLGDLVIAAACAMVSAGVILAGPVYEMLGRGHVTGVAHTWIQTYHSFLAGFVFPDIFTRFDPFNMTANVYHAGMHAASQWENGAYIGIPLLACAIVVAIRRWRTPLVRVGSVATLVVMGMSIGEYLDIDGHKLVATLHHHHVTVSSPYKLLTKLPYVENIEPVRLMFLAWLGIALLGGLALDRMIAWYVARPHEENLSIVRRVVTVSEATGQMTVRKWRSVKASFRGLAEFLSWRLVVMLVVSALVVLSLLPASPYKMPSTDVASWLTSRAAAQTIPANSPVLFYPYPTLLDNHALIDQAVTDFHYKLIGGEGLVGNAKGVNVGIQPLSPITVPAVFIDIETQGDKKQLAQLPFTLPSLPPNDAATTAAFRQFVTQNDVSTVIVEGGNVAPGSEVVPYLESAFGLPTTHDGGSLLVWTKRQLDTASV